VEFRVLGPLEVLEEGRSVALPGPKARAVLVLLLLDANRVVPLDRLVDGLWDETPPETATKTLQVYVSQLRKALGAERIQTHARGYSVAAGPHELDAARFERLAGESRFDEALAVWRGPALADFREERFARDAASRLEELRLGAEEGRIDDELAAGRDSQVVADLERLVAEHPLRERLRGQLMLALYRSGRQSEALELFRRTRAELVDALGVEPGPELQELHRAILAQSPELAAGRPRPVPPDPERSPLDPERWLPDPVLTAFAALLATAALVAVILAGATRSDSAVARELQVFAVKVDNLLQQSSDGRTSIKSTIDGALACRIPPRAAARQITTAERNRQSVLQQIAALSVPNHGRAIHAAALLQRALAASIAADWRYRDWLASLKACPRGMTPPPTVAAADARSTRLKTAFVREWNIVAGWYGLPRRSPQEI
jgi:DNA-binding SARP family transcriptional activator